MLWGKRLGGGWGRSGFFRWRGAPTLDSREKQDTLLSTLYYFSLVRSFSSGAYAPGIVRTEIQVSASLTRRLSGSGTRLLKTDYLKAIRGNWVNHVTLRARLQYGCAAA